MTHIISCRCMFIFLTNHGPMIDLSLSDIGSILVPPISKCFPHVVTGLAFYATTGLCHGLIRGINRPA